MALLIVSSETALTDVSDTSGIAQNQHTDDQSQHYNFNDDESHSKMDIKKILIDTEKNLQIIMKISGTTFDKLVNELQLSLLKQLKQSLKQLKINQSNQIDSNNNNTNNENEEKQMQMVAIEYHEHAKTDNLNFHVSSILSVDNATVVSATTAFTGITKATGVSSIAPPLSMNDPLIIMMGIGEYNGMDNLDGVSRDYDNIIDTFVKCWKYKIFYKLKNNTSIYSNNINDIDNNYKLEWNGDEIDDFIEEARKHVVKNKHNGLMFAISSHGDSGRVLYDSECEQYELDAIFSMYSAQASALLESYQETQEESNRLLSIPKIFLLDMCRGNAKAKVTQIEIENETTMCKDEMKKEEKTNETLALSLHNNKETFTVKGINKEEAHKLVAQMANFSKIYANTEGFSVMGGSQQGGIFMRSVCKIFRDTKYVSNHKFTDIIFKIREYTKRNATLTGELFNFTQIVENEGTLEREVVFASKYINIVSQSLLTDDSLGTLGEHDNVEHFIPHGDDNSIGGDDHESNKICITNASSTNKIAVLVEMEQNRENRTKMFRILEKSTSTKDDNYGAFVEYGFVMIDKNYDLHEFVKVWNEYYVTMFSLSDDGTNRNGLVYDRRLYFNDYLYFKQNKLYTLHDNDILPKCNGDGNASHTLHPIAHENNNSNNNNSSNDSKSSTEMECRLCATAMNISDNDVSFECKSCQEALCKHCCHSLIVNKIPQNMKESKYFEITMINASKTNKIAVLVNIYASVYNTQRYNMIESAKYTQIKDEKEFINNGFVIIDNGEQHRFKTVWQSSCITIVQIANFNNDANDVNTLVFDEQKAVGEYPLYYTNIDHDNGKLFYMQDMLPQCQSQHSVVLVSNNKSNHHECLICLSKIKKNSFSCYCQECKEPLCRKCIDLIMLNKFASNFSKIKTQQIRVFNHVASDNKIGVLLDAHYLEKFRRRNMMNYQDLNERQLIKQGFTIIDPGQVVSINTTCNSYFATFVRLKSTKADVICDMKPFTCSELIFYNEELLQLLEEYEDTKCNIIKNESHVLTRVLMDKESINDSDNLNVCVFCSSQIEIENYYYYCKPCKHLLCRQCFDLIVFKKTALRLKRYDLIQGAEQKPKRLMELTLKKPPAENVQYKIKTCLRITNGRQIQNEYLIEIPPYAQTEEVFYHTIELNIDELRKECKESESHCNINVELVVMDPQNKIQCSFHPIINNILVFVGIEYCCTFTTLNGSGIYGPTSMDDYKGQCHFNDTKLDVKHTNLQLLSLTKGKNDEKTNNEDEGTGMQLWTVPKTGKYKVICYGAKGGDSIWKKSNKHLFGGKGAKVGSIFKLFENDIIKIACGQSGQNAGVGGGAGGGGGSYFVLSKIGNKNPNYNENEIVNIPLCVAAGGNGACNAYSYKVDGIDGRCDTAENRHDYRGYKTNGKAGRGASFRDDFDIFRSYKNDYGDDFNKCNPKSFLDGAIGGKGYVGSDPDGGFGGGGGGSRNEGGGGGGYIGGIVSRQDLNNTDSKKYSSYGALSYICQNINVIHNNMMISISGQNNGNGKVEIMFMG